MVWNYTYNLFPYIIVTDDFVYNTSYSMFTNYQTSIMVDT